MKTKTCLSVPGQKGGAERMAFGCLYCMFQEVLFRDRKAGQDVWDIRAGTERPGTDGLLGPSSNREDANGRTLM